MEEDAVALGLYVAGLMDAYRVQPKQVAFLSGEAQSTVSRLRTGSRKVNKKQMCQILFAAGRAYQQDLNGQHKVKIAA
jgi:hypothetical protein